MAERRRRRDNKDPNILTKLFLFCIFSDRFDDRWSSSNTLVKETTIAQRAILRGCGSYWASKLGVAGPVEFVVDLGITASLDAAEIIWEFPAKSFSVMTEKAGSWSEVFSTSSLVGNDLFCFVSSVSVWGRLVAVLPSGAAW